MSLTEKERLKHDAFGTRKTKEFYAVAPKQPQVTGFYCGGDYWFVPEAPVSGSVMRNGDHIKDTQAAARAEYERQILANLEHALQVVKDFNEGRS